MITDDSWRDCRGNAGVGDSGPDAPRCGDTGVHAAYQLTTPSAAAAAAAAAAGGGAAATMIQDGTCSERDILVDACRNACTPHTSKGLRP